MRRLRRRRVPRLRAGGPLRRAVAFHRLPANLVGPGGAARQPAARSGARRPVHARQIPRRPRPAPRAGQRRRRREDARRRAPGGVRGGNGMAGGTGRRRRAVQRRRRGPLPRRSGLRRRHVPAVRGAAAAARRRPARAARRHRRARRELRRRRPHRLRVQQIADPHQPGVPPAGGRVARTGPHTGARRLAVPGGVAPPGGPRAGVHRRDARPGGNRLRPRRADGPARRLRAGRRPGQRAHAAEPDLPGGALAGGAGFRTGRPCLLRAGHRGRCRSALPVPHRGPRRG